MKDRTNLSKEVCQSCHNKKCDNSRNAKVMDVYRYWIHGVFVLKVLLEYDKDITGTGTCFDCDYEMEHMIMSQKQLEEKKSIWKRHTNKCLKIN